MSDYAPVTDASAWRGAEIASDPAWISTLTGQEVEDLAAALRGVQARGIPTTAITRADFPLPILAARLAAWLAEARDGRGFFVVRGLPAGRFDETEREAIFWGLGTHLG